MDQYEQARRKFGDSLSLFDIRHGNYRDLVDAAVGLLLANPSLGPGTVALACATAIDMSNRWVMDDLVAGARAEQDILPLSPYEAALRAAQGKIRSWAAGQLSDRELAVWGAQDIGWDCPHELEPIVEADVAFFELEYITWTEADIHDLLGKAAQEILAMPDPWAH